MTHTYALTFDMAAPGGTYALPGTTAELAWGDPESGLNVLTIPASATLKGDDGTDSVWVFDADSSSTRQQKVTLGGLTGSSRTVVISGLEPGDSIVIRGGEFITAASMLTPIQSRAGLLILKSKNRYRKTRFITRAIVSKSLSRPLS